MLNQTRWALATLVVNAGLLACSADPSDPIGGTGGSSGTGTGTGGAAPTLGGSSNGGAPATSGGALATSGGALATSGGAPTTGGITGGSGAPATSGGATTGGFTGGSGAPATSGGATIGGKSGSGGATSGGATSGGATSGGKTGSGGATSGGATSGGKTGSGGSSGGTTNTGAGPSTTCGCTKSAGEFSGNPVGSEIEVTSGEVYDGKCMTFRASSALGDGTQKEGQKPIFIINGGTLQNVIINNSAADGVHIEGPATLKNVHWLDIGEDAMSIGSSIGGNPTVNFDCGSTAQGSDKTFQVNAASTWNLKNLTCKTAGKFMRQNGDSTFKMTVNIDHCDIADMSECIYRTDSSSSIVNMTNTRYHNVGTLFIFGDTEVAGDTHNQVGTFTGNVSY